MCRKCSMAICRPSSRGPSGYGILLNVITFSKIEKTYTVESSALSNISLTIPTGDFVSVVGQSGAGKSTLLKLISAEERPSSGSLVIDGWDITRIKKWLKGYQPTL